MKKICPNCGKEVDPEEKYCPFCHFNLVNTNKTIVTVDVGLLGLKKPPAKKKKIKQLASKKLESLKKEGRSSPKATSPVFKPKAKTKEDKTVKNNPALIRKTTLPKSKNKKFKFKWSLVVEIIIAALVVFIIIGTHYYSRKTQINRIETELKDGKVNNLTTKSSVPLTAKNLQPLRDYYKNNPAAYKKLKKSLMGKNNGPIKLVKSGNRFLIFPHYVLQLPTYDLNVVNDYQRAKVTVNGEKAAKNQKVFPGLYHISAKTSYADQKAEFKKAVNVWQNQTEKVKLNVKTFKLKGMPQAQVYLNKEKVGTLNKKGNLLLVDVPMNNSFSIYAAKKQKGKLVKTKTIKNVPALVKKAKEPVVLKLRSNNKSIKSLLTTSFNKPKKADFVRSSKNSSYHNLSTLIKNWKDSPTLVGYKARISLENKDLNNLQYLVKFDFKFNRNGKRFSKKQVMRFRNGIIQKSHGSLKIKTIGGGVMVSSK